MPGFMFVSGDDEEDATTALHAARKSDDQEMMSDETHTVASTSVESRATTVTTAQQQHRAEAVDTGSSSMSGSLSHEDVLGMFAGANVDPRLLRRIYCALDVEDRDRRTIWFREGLQREALRRVAEQDLVIVGTQQMGFLGRLFHRLF